MNRTITVKGVGSTSVKPDYITIFMTVESVRKDYNEAMEDAVRRIGKCGYPFSSAGERPGLWGIKLDRISP